MIQPERISILNHRPVKTGQYILYWMQAAQRETWNHALEWAIVQSREKQLPVVVLFCLVSDFPEANLRHYRFMLEGLRDTEEALQKRGIQFVIQHAPPHLAVPALAQEAALVVTDTGHLRIQRQWRIAVAKAVPCTMYEVETNLIVPVETASEKENFSAGTIRPRIHRQLDRFMVPLRRTPPIKESQELSIPILDLDDLDTVLSQLDLDEQVRPVAGMRGGAKEATKKLRHFLKHKLDFFSDRRNDPSVEYTSGLSPYLHFGQLSPLEVALAVSATESPGKASFLEELIVRRELAFNFVHYNQKYDQYEGLAAWALRTLNFHKRDKREVVYSFEQFERAETHDPYWNAAQLEMVHTGKMHGYMRMYWGKKILEWTRSPKEGFGIAQSLNNKYELDGRDPNAFAGVAWCFGQHDRAWSERPVFGKVRYMNANGLKRKFDIGGYVERVQGICPE